MIDTVAKAIMQWAIPFNDWDSQTEEVRERWRGATRVVIEAMREPTDIMTLQHGGRITNNEAAYVWRDMIDAALTPADG
jgi:hypothetical protein